MGFLRTAATCIRCQEDTQKDLQIWSWRPWTERSTCPLPRLGCWTEPGLRGRGVWREVNRESCAKGCAALDRNLSAVRLHTPAHESETEAPTDFAFRLGSLCSRERIKYVGLIFRRYHGSIVVHRN